MPTARSSLEANVVDGKIYLIGGSTGDYNLVSQNEVYDPETDTWSVEKRLPNPVQWYASAVVDNKIYVIGGYNYHVGMVNLTQVYEPATETWSMGAPIPLSLYGSAASTTGVLAPKRIYVIGGSTGIPFDGNFVYDPASDSWSRGADMPTARNGAGVAVVDDVLFVIGGDTSWYFAMLNANEQYTPYGYEPKPPAVTIFSPENKTYTDVNVSLTFMVNRPVVWIGFSLDGHDNVTIAGNTTLFGLSTGMHNVTVYAKDAFENTGNATINFTIAKVPEPFPVAPVATVSVATVAVVGMGLLIYFKKRKH
jgi:N-acetylneuraminic acid mutarotase